MPSHASGSLHPDARTITPLPRDVACEWVGNANEVLALILRALQTIGTGRGFGWIQPTLRAGGKPGWRAQIKKRHASEP